jgi:hypothetical protein
LVAVLELAVVLAVLLDGVVGEVDEVVADVVGREELRCGADVAFAEEVEMQGVGEQAPDTDVEFAGVD